MLLTIYIPTFNRASRLQTSIADVFREIKNCNLELSVAVIVGDNHSSDATPEVCFAATRSASREGISFSYFRNSNNLGFSGNIARGVEEVNSGWIMFLSDDDNLCNGGLSKVCDDLKKISPSVSLYNFAQPPFDFGNPVISKNSFSTQNTDYSQMQSLVTWPKLTGIVLKVQPMINAALNIKKISKISKHFPHVTLALYIFSESPGLLKSQVFLGKPDEDFLEHINFLPYIGEYLIKELELYSNSFEPNNETLKHLITQIPRTSILDASVNALIGFYRGRTKITKKVKANLIDNLLRLFFGKRETRDGLAYSKPSKIFFIKLLLLPIIVLTSVPLVRIKGRELQLMDEGF